MVKANAIIKAKRTLSSFEAHKRYMDDLASDGERKIREEKEHQLKLKKMREDDQETCNQKTLASYCCMITLFVAIALLVLSF